MWRKTCMQTGAPPAGGEPVLAAGMQGLSGEHAWHAQMRGMSSALSAASAACDHVRDWVHGTPPGTFVSMGVFSDGSYGAPKVRARAKQPILATSTDCT